MHSPEKRFNGAATVMPANAEKSKSYVPSETNLRSNVPTTVMESSLRDDDMMISASLVDPLESRSMRNKSILDASEKFKEGISKPTPLDDLVQKIIEEEDSSLKSLSPLSDASESKKSSNVLSRHSLRSKNS